MAKIRRTIISEIYSALESSEFSVRDFNVNLEPDNSFVHITFAPFPEYTFQITEKDVAVRNFANMLTPTPSDMRLYTIESPGEYKISSSRQSSSIHDCISRIPKWCENIQAELSAPIPEDISLEKFEEELSEQINEKAGSSLEPFSDDEVQSLTSKLEALNTKFEELKEANEITEKELLKVREDVERMKSNLSVYPKSTWYKVSGNKLLDIMKYFVKTKEGRALIFSSVKKLLERL